MASLGATFSNQQIIEIQCSGASGATSGLPLPTSTLLKYNALALLGLPWCYLCNQQIIEIQCSGATGATLGLPLPTSKSLDFIALGLSGLPWGYICQQANHWISLFWGYWGYLEATFATEQNFGFHRSAAIGATLGPSLRTRLIILLKNVDFKGNSTQTR